MPTKRSAINGGFYARTAPDQTTQFTILVDDVTEAIRRVEGAGGTLVSQGFELPGVGFFSIVTDTEGTCCSQVRTSPSSGSPSSGAGMSFTNDEVAYLRSRGLTRFATVGPDGQPGVVPLGLEFDGSVCWVGVGDAFASTRKFRSVAAGNDRVVLASDALLSLAPFATPCLRVYGRAGPRVERVSALVGPGLLMRITPNISSCWSLQAPVADGWYEPRPTRHVDA